MRRLTIAELRTSAIRRASAKYNIEHEELKKLMNRYYRLCGAYERLLVLENSEDTCNSSYTLELESQTMRRFDKLNADFRKNGLELKFFGYVPTICELATTATAIDRYFYN